MLPDLRRGVQCTLEINFSDLVRFTPFELVLDSQSSFCLYHPRAELKFMLPGLAACLYRPLLDLLIFLVYITYCFSVLIVLSNNRFMIVVKVFNRERDIGIK